MIRHEWFNQIFFIEKTLSVFAFIYALLYARIPFLTGKMKEKEKNNHYDNKNREQIFNDAIRDKEGTT